jgi:hypothetical protein
VASSNFQKSNARELPIEGEPEDMVAIVEENAKPVPIVSGSNDTMFLNRTPSAFFQLLNSLAFHLQFEHRPALDGRGNRFHCVPKREDSLHLFGDPGLIKPLGKEKSDQARIAEGVVLCLVAGNSAIARNYDPSALTTQVSDPFLVSWCMRKLVSQRDNLMLLDQQRLERTG